MWTVFPEIVEPDCEIELETITPISAGSGGAGGGGLLPGAVVQLTPHAGLAGALAKPLNAAGALPPESELTFHHCAPQKVTEPVALWSPTTNAPPPEPMVNTVA